MEIDNDNKNLIDTFKLIAKKRYIKGVNMYSNSIGLTFEKELNKKADSMYFPDFYGIEIKCTGRFSRYPISLFTAAFDGPTFPEIDRLLNNYGYYDKDFKDKKVLFANLNCHISKLFNKNFIFRLDFSFEEEKVYLCIYDINNNLIERKSYIFFETLYNHLLLKLKKMAIVYGSIKRESDAHYFRYYKIEIYNLISKERFLELLMNKTIMVQLIARVSRSGDKKGQYRNKNLLFQIKKEDIEKLFKKIYLYDYDNYLEKCYF